MVSSFTRSVLLVGVSALSARAQTTTPPPAPAATITPVIQAPPLPLTEYHFTYPNLPQQVNPFQSARGPQSGYNICNSTTEGPQSLCQTAFVNTIDDFCLWGSPTPNGIIGNIEAITVAYCTKAGHGTRLIPPGALTAVQFLRAPGYIQVTGLINQTLGLGIDFNDAGGELDPHGADLAGNPLGGLVFSSNLPTARDKTIVQVNNWSNFVGGNQFCIKACDNSITNPDYCENRFDTQGCGFNMPASYKPGEFSDCLSDNQAPPGAAPVIPASSSCTTYQSTAIFSNAPTSTSSSAPAGATTAKSSSAPATSKSSSGAPASFKQSGSGLWTAMATVVAVAFTAGLGLMV